MAKKIVQDVLPPERSIRNIPLSSKTRSRRTSPVSTALSSRTRSGAGEKVIDEEKVRSTSRKASVGGGNGSRSRKMLWLISSVCFLAVVFSFSIVFVSATVTITPKQWPLPISLELGAAKNSETLPYSLITVSREVTRTVPASGEETVEEKASGLITIFNTQTGPSQKLVKNTRFESPTGLIFRIGEAVTVPGATTKGTTTVPGSITVKVTADKPGSSYNIGLADFTIPGFAGDPKFKTITAKSDPNSPIRGGFVGKVAKVKEAELSLAYAAMEKELSEALANDIIPQVPQDQVYFPRTSSVSFEKFPVSNASTGSGTTSATLKQKGTLTAVLFNQSQLVTALSKSLPDEARGIDLEVTDWSGVTFTYKNNDQTKALKGDPIQFTLQGNIVPRARVDVGVIQNELAGKPRSAFASVLSGIPSVAQAQLTIRPVWAWKLPKNQEKINVAIQGL